MTSHTLCAPRPAPLTTALTEVLHVFLIMATLRLKSFRGPQSFRVLLELLSFDPSQFQALPTPTLSSRHTQYFLFPEHDIFYPLFSMFMTFVPETCHQL